MAVDVPKAAPTAADRAAARRRKQQTVMEPLPIERIDASSLTDEKFFQNYVLANKPVVIRGAMIELIELNASPLARFGAPHRHARVANRSVGSFVGDAVTYAPFAAASCQLSGGGAVARLAEVKGSARCWRAGSVSAWHRWMQLCATRSCGSAPRLASRRRLQNPTRRAGHASRHLSNTTWRWWQQS